AAAGSDCAAAVPQQRATSVEQSGRTPGQRKKTSAVIVEYLA
ncbi:hypothetical protein B1M_38491, partial [Burkholderia sp. TJI49]